MTLFDGSQVSDLSPLGYMFNLFNPQSSTGGGSSACGLSTS